MVYLPQMSLKLWWLQQLFCYQTLKFTNMNWGLQGWRKESLPLQTNYLKLLSIPVSEHHSLEGRVHLSVTQLGIKFMSLSWWWEQVKKEGAQGQDEEWGKEGHRITRWHKGLEIRAAWAYLLRHKALLTHLGFKALAIGRDNNEMMSYVTLEGT
jgi:hypothetical protein